MWLEQRWWELKSYMLTEFCLSIPKQYSLGKLQVYSKRNSRQRGSKCGHPFKPLQPLSWYLVKSLLPEHSNQEVHKEDVCDEQEDDQQEYDEPVGIAVRAGWAVPLQNLQWVKRAVPGIRSWCCEGRWRKKRIVMANPNATFLYLILWKWNHVYMIVYIKRYCIVVQDVCSPRTLQRRTLHNLAAHLSVKMAVAAGFVVMFTKKGLYWKSCILLRPVLSSQNQTTSEFPHILVSSYLACGLEEKTQ